mmetsp:Transcript_4131/g.6988  ORF Transcript_4131/g.6988 Transcript_4131/m.6988 type:complete len:207 (+) Transcript_4131:831-1451(+)
MNTNGVGMGLFTAKRVVQSFGGEIECESELGSGAQFTFNFELSDPELAQDAGAIERCFNPIKQPHPAFAIRGARAKRLLLVDDQSFNIDALRLLMSVSGIEGIKGAIDSAEDGALALNRVRLGLESQQRQVYGLILMDLDMPNMNGFQATEAIRKLYREEGIEQPMIIAQTGHYEPSYIEKAFRYAMDEVLAKPVNEKLVKLILRE